MDRTPTVSALVSRKQPRGSRALMSDQRDIGQGYPEEQPDGAGGGPPSPGEGGDEPSHAPDPSPERDSDPEKSTGNPGA